MTIISMLNNVRKSHKIKQSNVIYKGLHLVTSVLGFRESSGLKQSRIAKIASLVEKHS